MSFSKILKLIILLVWLEGIKSFQHGYFWHISDLHVDQNYSRTGNPQNMCHSDNRKAFSDNGLYGNFLCDSPQHLINVTVAAMKRINPVPDFIVWTGDNLPHTDNLEPNWNVTYEAIRNISLLLSSTFREIPIIPCIGNHDTFPPNMLPLGDESKTIYQGYLEHGGWNKLLPEEAWSTFIYGGYFSQLVKPKLRVISLNTILWYTPNRLTIHSPDPANQFLWLDHVLWNSSQSSEKVYIIGHVAPGFYSRVVPGTKGDSTYHPQHLRAMNSLLEKYSSIIIGQMYGHYHTDMFTVSRYNTPGAFMGSALLASSITPWHSIDPYNVSLAVNPSIRLMHFSPVTGALLDYDQFYLNLTQANANTAVSEETESQLYQKLYSFTEFYKVPDLSTSSLVQVYESLKRDPALFSSFYTFLAAGEQFTSCDNGCKVAQLCAMSCTCEEEYDSCMRNVDHVRHITQKLASNVPRVNSALVYGSVVLALVIVSLAGFLLFRRFRKPSDRSQYQPFSHF